MNQFLQLTVLGIVQGAFLLLAALGFSLTRRVEGFLNIAHAQYLSIAAFVTYYLTDGVEVMPFVGFIPYDEAVYDEQLRKLDEVSGVR